MQVLKNYCPYSSWCPFSFFSPLYGQLSTDESKYNWKINLPIFIVILLFPIFSRTTTGWPATSTRCEHCRRRTRGWCRGGRPWRRSRWALFGCCFLFVCFGCFCLFFSCSVVGFVGVFYCGGGAGGLQGEGDRLLLFFAGERGQECPVNVPEGKGRPEKSNRGDAAEI